MGVKTKSYEDSDDVKISWPMRTSPCYGISPVTFYLGPSCFREAQIETQASFHDRICLLKKQVAERYHRSSPRMNGLENLVTLFY